MSKQPKEVRDRLARLKASGVVLPQAQDQRQLWILVRKDPTDDGPGEFFVTHAANFAKFDDRKKPWFTVMAHSYDKVAIAAAARRANQIAGPNFKQPTSEQLGRKPTESEADHPLLDMGDGDVPLNDLQPGETESPGGIILPPDFDS